MAAKGEVEDSEEDRKADGRGEDRAIGKRRKPKMEGGAFEAKSLYVFYSTWYDWELDATCLTQPLRQRPPSFKLNKRTSLPTRVV